MVNSKYLNIFLAALPFFLLASGCEEKIETSSLPKIGAAALDFSCRDLEGRIWTLEETKGKVLLLRFWADWCPYCRFEMPIIDQYYRRLKQEGFLVLAVNVKQRAEVALAFTAQLDVTFPVPLDPDGKLAQRHGVYAIPTNFLIDRQGIVREILIGEVFREEAVLRDLLKEYFKF